MECKTGSILPSYLLVGLISSFQFVCYCQKHKHFGLSSIVLGRRSIVKTDKAPVIISVSLHHKEYDNLCEIQHKNAEWCRAIIDMCCFTVLIFSWAPCKCVYYTLLKVRGQCALWFWWLLCLWMWPAMNIIIFRGTSWMQAEWSLSTAIVDVVPLKLLHRIPPPL
jgi:hypothetical protein